MYADRMHCLLQILALCFIKDNLVRIKESSGIKDVGKKVSDQKCQKSLARYRS